MTLGAGNVDNGDFETFDQVNTPFDELHYAALASGSIPGVFPPVQWRDMNLMDGGTIYDVNINSAVHQCLELVEDESQIIVDVAICAPEKVVGFETVKNAAKNYWRSQGLHRKTNGMNAINWQQRSFPNVQYRYLFYYEDAIFSPAVLDFRNETTWPMQENGREQAKKVMQMGEGTGFKALEDW